MIKYLYIAIALLASHVAHAQDSCAVNYQQALVLFDQGYVDKAISLLGPCTESNLKGMDAIDYANIYWLLARAHALRKESDISEKFYRKTLEYRPRFEPHASDLEDIRLMHARMQALPKLAFYVGGGPMYSFINLRRRHEILSGDVKSRKTSINNPLGYHFGLGAYRKFSKYIQLHGELQVWGQFNSYTQLLLDENRRYNVTSNGSVYDTLGYIDYTFTQENTHTQRFNFLSIPLLGRGLFPVSKSLSLYLEGGGYASFLFGNSHHVASTETDVLRNHNLKAGTASVSVSVDEQFAILATRTLFKPVSFGYIAGAGVQLQVKKRWYCHFGVRYQQSLVNMTKQEARFRGSPLLSFYDVADDFSINSLSAQASWIIPIRHSVYDIKPKRL